MRAVPGSPTSPAADSLVDAAWRLFAHGAPSSVTTRTIARAAGCTHGTITLHFGGKAGLVRAVADRLGLAIEHVVTTACASGGFPFAELLAARRSHPDAARLLARVGLGDLDGSAVLGGSTLGVRLVERIEESRGGSPRRPTQRSRVAAYGALCLLAGVVTSEDLTAWGSGSHALSEQTRDEAVVRALLLIVGLASDTTADLRLPRSREPDPGPPESAAPHGASEVREALIGAALELFTTKGPAAISVRQIAQRAGVNHSLVTRYFGTKEALIDAAIDRGAGAVYKGIQSLDGISIAALVRLQRRALNNMITARVAADGGDIRIVRPETPVLRAVVNRYPNVPTGDGDGTLHDPRLAVFTSATMVAGASLWDGIIRQLVGLPLDDQLDIDAPLTVFAERILSVPLATDTPH